MTDIISFGEWVQKRRNQLRYTRKQLADLVICSAVTIKKIERDERRPSSEIADLLAQHLQVPEPELENFMARARGEFVPSLASPAELAWEDAQDQDIKETFQHNLPPQSTTFFGRAQELADIANKLADPACRLITILGAGGMGKTRLSIAAAEAQLDNYADGVAYIELAPVSPTATDQLNPLTGALAETLGISFYAGVAPDQQLFDYLRPKEILLVFDNFEHLLDTAVFLSNLLIHAPTVKILVTSRERLNLQEEWLFPLHGLSMPQDTEPAHGNQTDAAQLFAQRGQQVNPAFDLEAEWVGVQQICRVVEGMPLGLELAAAWVNQLSCQEIAAEIESELDILSTEMRNIPDRHRSVRAVFGYSWEKLSPKERDVLKKLSVFRGGFERKGAKAVAGASLATLAQLVDKSFLSATPNGRYQIHELLRQFAADRLANSPDLLLEAQKQHAIFYLTYVEHHSLRRPGNTDLSMMQNLESEIDNIRTAIQHSLNHAPELFLNMAVWEALCLFFEVRNWFTEGIQTMGAIAQALEPACHSYQMDETSPPSERCFYWAMYQLTVGISELRSLQVAKAGETMHQAVQMLDERYPHHRKERGLGYYWLGGFRFHQDKAPEAEAYYLKAIELLQGTEWIDYYGTAYLIYAMLILSRERDLTKAEPLVNEGAKFVSQVEHRWFKGLAWYMQAWVIHSHGDHLQAEQLVRAAIEITAPLKYSTQLDYFLERLTHILVDQGRVGEARRETLKIIRLIHNANVPFRPQVIMAIARMKVQAQQFDLALQLLAFIKGFQSPVSLVEQARQMWDELASELPDAFMAEAEAKGKALDRAKIIEILLAEGD